MENNRPKLKRAIDLWGLSSNIINIVIGAGIFVMPAIIAEKLGASSSIAYFVCAFLISLIMLCYAEIGSKITASGGTYTYIERTLGPYYGFVSLFLFLLATISADAAVANTIIDLLGTFFPYLKQLWIKITFFIILFGIMGTINYFGVEEGIRFVKAITIIKLTPLILIILLGTIETNFNLYLLPSAYNLENVGGAALLLFFAFQGAESGLSISGEVKKPNKTIPRAIALSITIVFIIYILLQLIAQSVLGPDLLNHPENPLGMVAQALLGPWGITLIAISAIASMIGNLSSEILSIPRVLYQSAKDLVIPISALGKIHKTYATPHIAIITYVTVCLLFAIFGGFTELAVLSSASILILYLGVAVSVIKLRIINKKKPFKKTFTIPGGYVVPVGTVIVIIWFLSHLSQTEILGIVSYISVLSLIYLFIIKTMKKN